MYCPKCGTENPEQAKFCKGCGHPLQAVTTGPPPGWVWWGVGLVLTILIIGGGLLLRSLLPSSLVMPSPATVTTTSTPEGLAETATPTPNPTQEIQLTLTLPHAPTAELTSTPSPTFTPTPTPFPPTPTSLPSPTPDPFVQCAGAPQQGVHVGDLVYVCTHPDRLTLRATPSRSGDEVQRMEPGAVLTIVDGPTCADEWLWWHVQTGAGDRGWVAEGGTAITPYFICQTLPCEPVTGVFAQIWGTVQQDIGCKTGNAFRGFVAEEHFAGGIMFWREAFDQARSPVLFNNGTWRFYHHTPFVEGSPDFACVDANTPAQCPPTPIRGFGMMWCNIPELRERLGNAVDCERGYQATMQTFEKGFMLRNDQGTIYILFDDGTWQRR